MRSGTAPDLLTALLFPVQLSQLQGDRPGSLLWKAAPDTHGDPGGGAATMARSAGTRHPRPCLTLGWLPAAEADLTSCETGPASGCDAVASVPVRARAQAQSSDSGCRYPVRPGRCRVLSALVVSVTLRSWKPPSLELRRRDSPGTGQVAGRLLRETRQPWSPRRLRPQSPGARGSPTPAPRRPRPPRR